MKAERLAWLGGELLRLGNQYTAKCNWELRESPASLECEKRAGDATFWALLLFGVLVLAHGSAMGFPVFAIMTVKSRRLPLCVCRN